MDQADRRSGVNAGPELLQTPDQRITKRVEVRSAHSEICMLPTRVPDDRLKQFTLIKRPDDCSDHVHELEMLPLHVAWEQTFRIVGEFEKPAIEQLRDFASDRPNRIEYRIISACLGVMA